MGPIPSSDEELDLNDVVCSRKQLRYKFPSLRAAEARKALRYPKRPHDAGHLSTIKVTSLPVEITINDLIQTFEPFGDLADVFIPKHAESKIPYWSIGDALKALHACDGSVLMKNRIRASWYEPSLMVKPKCRKRFRDLPNEVVKKIFAMLDWRARLRCECVQSRFLAVSRSMYTKPLWNGLPFNRLRFVLLLPLPTRTKREPLEFTVTGEYLSTNIRINDAHADYKHLLHWSMDALLERYGSTVSDVEFYRISATPEMLEILRRFLPVNATPKILLDRVRMGDIGIEQFLSFWSEFGNRVKVLPRPTGVLPWPVRCPANVQNSGGNSIAIR